MKTKKKKTKDGNEDKDIKSIVKDQDTSRAQRDTDASLTFFSLLQ